MCELIDEFNPLDILDVQQSLPYIGQHLKKLPYTMSYDSGGIPLENMPDPIDCVVTLVNHSKLWYQVKFVFGANSYLECFKIPETSRRYY